MATVQVDGSSPVTPQTTFNDGGVFTQFGPTPVSYVMRVHQAAHGGSPEENNGPVDNDHADKCVSGGEFAHNHTHPISALLTTEIAGVASDVLDNLGNPQIGTAVTAIHHANTVRTTKLTSALRAGKWDEVNGVWASGYPQVSNDPWYDVNGNTTSATTTDDAARPTRAVPGELTYLANGKVPTNANYKAKTG